MGDRGRRPTAGGSRYPRVSRGALAQEPFFFRRPFRLWHRALDSCRTWEERELIATAVSQANLAQQCVTDHRPAAVAQLSEEEVVQALDDAERRSVVPTRRALLELAERLTLAPDEMRPEGVGRAVAAGASVDRLRDAVEVAAVMNVMNRIKTALERDPDPGEEQ